jgi:cytoskeleton protein RodZ
VPLIPLKKRSEPVDAFPAPEAPVHRQPRRVGDLLRETRQGFGGSIEQIGATLRIRAAYLSAIEESQYDRLPGNAYAVGFVRSYAEHLGLDGAEIVRRYKGETSELVGEPADLSFPMPLPDRGKPGATILVVALIVAACGYATWYYLASGERARPERVAEVPAQLLPPPAPVPAPDPVLATEPQPGETATAADAPAPGAAVTEPTPSGALASPLPGAAMPATSAFPASPAPGSQASSLAGAPAASPFTGMPASPSSLPPQIATAPSGAVPEVPEASAAPEGPRVYGVTNGPARIVIKAATESWIQVRDRDNVVSVRTLKPGESYRVPDRSGLTLRTGNAGGLELSVDGKTVPPVGPPGKSRNVALDPDRLIAGRAAE